LKKELSRTQQALALMRDEKMTPYAAAKQLGLSPSAIYVAERNEKDRQLKDRCPCCDAVLRPQTKIIDIAAAERERVAQKLEESNKGQTDDELADIIQQVANIIRMMK
jgi:hypothetical protein